MVIFAGNISSKNSMDMQIANQGVLMGTRQYFYGSPNIKKHYY